MRKCFLLLAVAAAAAGCSRKTTVEVAQKPLTTAEILKTAKVNKYVITSPYGHEFTVEVTRFDAGDQTYNNTCRVTYIVTNTGSKDFRYRELFHKTGNNAAMEGDPAIVFEFSTTDGKTIEKTQFFYDDISAGHSSEVRNLSIDVGLRNCDGEVKPVRMQYKLQ